ncbi:hypothetical protein ACFQ4C_18010 [Larkinella insperata]|uniref:Uncharacterized protein n=1 Tax=Larkinella insperata TaxID=332158 RepID=A0ABW3Q728_9BACT|nr:hypothetical protein [Larkinella insperata]
MNKSTKKPAARELPALPYQLVGVPAHVTHVFVPATNRSYVLADLTAGQCEQLVRVGWPHIERIEPKPVA